MDNQMKKNIAMELFLFIKSTFYYQKNHPGLLFVFLSSISMIVAYQCTIPMLFRWLINVALIKKETNTLFFIFTALAISFVIVLIAYTLVNILSARLGCNTTNQFRYSMFKKIQKIPTEQLDDTYRSTLLLKFSRDVEYFESIFIHTVPNVLINIGVFFIGLIFLFCLNWQLTLVVIGFMLMSIALTSYFFKLNASQLINKNRNQSSILASVQESITMQSIIRLLCLKQYKKTLFKKILSEYQKINYPYHLSFNFAGEATLLSTMITRLLVLAIGSYLVMVDTLLIGDVVAFIVLLSSVDASLVSLSYANTIIINGAESLGQIEKLLEENSHTTKAKLETSPAFSDCIQFKDVNVHYGDHQAIANLNLEIRRGKSVAFVGPSGSGKSTILKLLLKDITPSSGQILFDKINLEHLSTNSLLAQMGVVTQSPMLFETTIRENIRMGKLDATQDEIIEAAKKAEIHQDILKLPEQYNTLIKFNSSGLSGGQCQRIVIARALVNNPNILCLDEATSALDPFNGAAIDETLNKMKGSRVVIAITHRLRSVIDMDVIFVVNNGRVIETGTHEQLLKTGDLYKKLWEKQNGITYSLEPNKPAVTPHWLKSLAFFKSLDEKSLNILANEFMFERVEPDQIIINEGEYGDRFYIIAAGIVEISSNDSNGKEIILAKLVDGDYFGEIALFYDLPRTAQVKSKGVCILLILSRYQFKKIFENFPMETQQKMLDIAKMRLKSRTSSE